jgi:hypothetical protein
MQRTLCALVCAASVCGSVSADWPSKLPVVPSPYEPCFLRGEDASFALTQRTVWELTASGTCRCADNTCKEISCSAEVGVSVEDTKRRLHAQLEAIARSKNGQLVGEVKFTLRKKF